MAVLVAVPLGSVMTSRVGEILVTSSGIFDEVRKGYDVIRWWGRLRSY